jgi:DMSO/TMAO reductase YedYZ molybdopterin-dependent catalytic subunit
MRCVQYALRTLTFGAALAIASAAWSAGFDNIILSAAEDAEATETNFSPETAKIFVSADLTDEVKSGSKVTVSWIAVDTGGAAPANYKIDEVDLDINMIDNHVNSALSRPNSGWPVGDYEVVFSVDGKPMEAVDFSVK